MSSWTLTGKRCGKLLKGSLEPEPRLPNHWLEAGNVLCLKALGAFLHFKFHCLTFVERLVAVHHDGREVDKNILSCLPLDEAVAL